MYQQQNFFGQQQAGQTQQHFHLQEQDAGNLVLSELKRAAREYTTAALESTHPAIRQTFASLTQKTLQDQAELFTVLEQMQGYGSVKMASQQEVQQELQQQIRKAEQLQSLVHQALQHSSISAAGMYQQQQQQQAQQAQYGMQHEAYAQAPSYSSGYGSGSAGYASQGVAASGSSASGGYGSQGALSGGAHGYSSASYAEQGYSQTGSPSYAPSASTAHGYAATSSQQDASLKSSVSGSDQQEYYSARSAQDYTGNQYSGGTTAESYGLKSQPEQTYSASGNAATSRHSSNYTFGAASHNASTTASGSTANASGSVSASGTKQQYGTDSSRNGKYMM
ncbi:hypothetical protein PAESOLCIP111_03468 [Paenibacillus solanacearum]|uniref:Spore coat protein n=1 Tax=Paenibacillus solanacearum TaxID=2048548 RepID=A0A916NQZ0_9BACL|nr:spore coat protein [Paenibacillus solanacearum]CAG7633468.1 hypothetical protein PAESOLCIP111_03468 [Paenibacillus solanacearum]